MVECIQELNGVFNSLSDPTRRDILMRVAQQSMSIRQIAEHYPLTFAAVAKHIDVLERAQLVRKDRRGKEQIVSIVPQTLAAADDYLDQYQALWNTRLDALGTFLENNKKGI